MIFLEILLLNTIAIISAFYIIKFLILRNYQIFAFIQLFNIYGAMSFVLLFSYLRFLTGYIIVLELLTFLVLLFFYIRAFDAANKKYHERFKVLILSFGYTK
ncbi:MAG: hypothetical protein WAO32_07985 [Defluviitoga tunisiensis]